MTCPVHQLESGKTKFKEVLESIRAGEQMAQRLAGEALLCQQAVDSLRVDFERNQKHLNRLRSLAEQHSNEVVAVPHIHLLNSLYS